MLKESESEILPPPAQPCLLRSTGYYQGT